MAYGWGLWVWLMGVVIHDSVLSFQSTSSPVAVDMTLDNNTGNCLFLNVRYSYC